MYYSLDSDVQGRKGNFEILRPLPDTYLGIHHLHGDCIEVQNLEDRKGRKQKQKIMV